MMVVGVTFHVLVHKQASALTSILEVMYKTIVTARKESI